MTTVIIIIYCIIGFFTASWDFVRSARKVRNLNKVWPGGYKVSIFKVVVFYGIFWPIGVYSIVLEKIVNRK